MTPEIGLKAFDTLLRQDTPSSVVTSIDWQVFQESVGTHMPLLSEQFENISKPEKVEAEIEDYLVAYLREMSPEESSAKITVLLQKQIQEMLRLSAKPEPETGFFDLGMDSLMAVEMRNRLNTIFKGAYTASNTLIFDYPNISQLASHLVDEVCHTEPEVSPPIRIRTPSVRPESDPIAVIGMACRFPGAPDLDHYWKLLESGTHAVSDSRSQDFQWHGVIGDPKASTNEMRRGGFVDEIEKFDAKFFNIRPLEARSLDPCHRMLLETTWHALENAGIDPQTLRGSRTGIYVGIGNSEYRELVRSRDMEGPVYGTSQTFGLGKLSYFLGLSGPAVSNRSGMCFLPCCD